jgi:hypothetical protein
MRATPLNLDSRLLPRNQVQLKAGLAESRPRKDAI